MSKNHKRAVFSIKHSYAEHGNFTTAHINGKQVAFFEGIFSENDVKLELDGAEFQCGTQSKTNAHGYVVNGCDYIACKSSDCPQNFHPLINVRFHGGVMHSESAVK